MSPIDELEAWIKEATDAGEIEPQSAALATAGKDGLPHVRFMLTKGFHKGHLVLVTNYTSPKSRDLDAQPWAEVAFYWKTLFRQARVAGPVVKAPSAFSDAYWASRPRESQLGAWASAQSAAIPSYEALEHKVSEMAQKFDGQTIPRPENWGAYYLTPQMVELWLGQKFRIHQRRRFIKTASVSNPWQREFLAP